jgi:hypothetical protein
VGRKKKQVEAPPTRFLREPKIIVNGFEIVRGDIIKVKCVFGSKFKFDSFVTNIDTGAQWVDCFELIGGVPSVFRSFKLDQVKRVPKRGKRGKRVN